MKILPPQNENLSFKISQKPKKNLKPLFLGRPMEHIKLNDFTLHGLPVPIYTHNPKLILLFKNRAECGDYLKRLYTIKNDFEACDPLCLKPAIQESIIFVNKVIKGLT